MTSFDYSLFLGFVLSGVTFDAFRKRLKRLDKRRAAYLLVFSGPGIGLPVLGVGWWISDPGSVLSFLVSTFLVFAFFSVANYASYCLFTEPE